MSKSTGNIRRTRKSKTQILEEDSNEDDEGEEEGEDEGSDDGSDDDSNSN